MRLFLSSFGISNCPERLVAMAGRGSRVGLVLNALDNFPRDRAERLASQTKTLKDLGFKPAEVDLRDHFSSITIGDALHDKGLLWISGGNAFILRRAMRQSGFDALISRLLAADRLMYAGFSAAACCAAPSLRGIELVDDPSTVPECYSVQVIWDGLRLIDYHIAPHYQSAHSESVAIDNLIAFYQHQNLPYRALQDGEALIVDGNETSIIG